MKLVEDSLLTLNDKVFGEEGIFNDSIYLNIRDPKLKDITVKHMLNHTSGWSQRYGDPMFVPLSIAKKMGVEPPVTVDTYKNTSLGDDCLIDLVQHIVTPIWLMFFSGK